MEWKELLKMRFSKLFFITTLFTLTTSLNAEDGHHHEDSHAHEKEEHSEQSEQKAGDEGHKDHDDDDHDEHEHGESEKGAHKHDDEHGAESFGEDKAIVEVMDEGNKFRLHVESIRFLNLEHATVIHLKEQEHSIPSSALVRFQNHTGVYRVIGDDVFEMIHLDVLKEEDGRAHVKSQKLRSDDRLVVSKLGNLRAAQLQASGQGGEGHAH